MTNSEMIKQVKGDFEKWWASEGSGLPPSRGEDASEHTRRVALLAWLGGATIGIEVVNRGVFERIAKIDKRDDAPITA